MTEMTDERLAAYRGLRDQIRETGEDDEFADAVDEIDRLRAELAAAKAENERLRDGAECMDCGETIRRCNFCAEQEEEWAR